MECANDTDRKTERKGKRKSERDGGSNDYIKPKCFMLK